ncbi:fimbria/pilus outer membrane usher protein [Burkholderia sp. BCC0322]|uniref:fimbria/pilus outer membrane usher protein n=1 Tax=unclassified Burkholderia TaxID=2613784 RepID=UPI001589EAE2|nr:fimbria/pilus outer membrane usher protein [Burkholderia sp. BCC0322]
MKTAHVLNSEAESSPSPLTRFCLAGLLAFSMAEAHSAADTLTAGEELALGSSTLEQDDKKKKSGTSSRAEAVQFNIGFLATQSPGIDVSRFEKGNPLLPGWYRVELYRNTNALGLADVRVGASSDPQRGPICMSHLLLNQIGIDVSKVDAQRLTNLEDAGTCVQLSDLVDQASTEFDTGELRLDVSVPQASLRRTPRGYVSPDLWDSGVSSGILGYTFNAYRYDSAGQIYNSAYVGVSAGVNLGKWHFRHNGAMNWQSRSAPKYQAINTYVERDLPSITSRLTVGERDTTGEVFDTLPFRGAQLATDDRMLPETQRGYAPVIRGIAETNARVTIRQGTSVIYDMPVAPGPFVIEDLYPSGFGGDLDVTVIEADGRVRTFSVAYASVPQLLRPGISRFSVTVGQIRNDYLTFRPNLLQATYQRGLNNRLTAYGGVQANQYYGAVLGGLALGTPIGALALDVTGARTRLPNSSLSGASIRLNYSKLITQTNSNISLAAYRFSTSGFLDMANGMQTVDAVRRGMSRDMIARPRNRFSVQLWQSLGQRWGHLSMGGYSQDYWNDTRRDLQYQIGYNNRFKSLYYSLSVNRVRNNNGQMENQFMANLSLPLGKSSGAPQVGVNVTTQPRVGTATQTNIQGVAGSRSQWGYGASVSNGPSGSGTSGSLNGQYLGSMASVQASAGMGSGYKSASVGISGSAVVHPEGISFTSYGSETVGIVVAPAAAGATILGYSNTILDRRGYGVVPHLTPYRLNEVAIDPRGIPMDVELKTTSQHVAPRAGSVVMIRFETTKGRAVMISSRQADGQPLPFGAEVVNDKGHAVGTVGQGGRIHARLGSHNENLSVRWGLAGNLLCSMRVALPEIPDHKAKSARGGFEHLELPCETAGAELS